MKNCIQVIFTDYTGHPRCSAYILFKKKQSSSLDSKQVLLGMEELTIICQKRLNKCCQDGDLCILPTAEDNRWFESRFHESNNGLKAVQTGRESLKLLGIGLFG